MNVSRVTVGNLSLAEPAGDETVQMPAAADGGTNDDRTGDKDATKDCDTDEKNATDDKGESSDIAGTSEAAADETSTQDITDFTLERVEVDEITVDSLAVGIVQDPPEVPDSPPANAS
ncbi:hypothetical protein C479_07573 [Halovivax asiaticus JCM 14624]|uniref:Uncharacterized protein n=1 Tax=Halovivax asiaticus JCM 14624 TaxID=1227490 RepID=M0BJX2_9EURY|nr:hypothetical protein [Halovivax asiaticus]ELZ11150.1 hypothetical protein C479_07573 [Halovivax asiaticus JCM 14624]